MKEVHFTLFLMNVPLWRNLNNGYCAPQSMGSTLLHTFQQIVKKAGNDPLIVGNSQKKYEKVVVFFVKNVYT